MRVPLKAVILAGGPGRADFGLANCYSPLGFPMAEGRPLLTHLLLALQKHGIQEVVVCLSKATTSCEQTVQLLRHYQEVAQREYESQEGNGSANGQVSANSSVARAESSDRPLRVLCKVDDGVKGAAGCLKDLQGFLGDSSFVVLGPDVWLDGIDLGKVFEVHRKRNAAATMVVEPKSVSQDGEHLKLSVDGRVEALQVLHESRSERPMRPTGIYVFEPAVLEGLVHGDYADIKEQLVSDLSDQGSAIYAYALDRPLPRIRSVADYFQLTRGILLNGWAERESDHTGETQITQGVRVAKDCEISPDAYLLGPVMVGPRCRIHAGAQIIGPVVLGAGTEVKEGALVRESFLWNACTVGRHASVSYSVVAHGCSIPAGEDVQNAVLVEDQACRGRLNLLGLGDDSDRFFVSGGPRGGGGMRPLRGWRRRRRAFDWSKRLVDLVVSGSLLVGLSPLLAVLALAVKWDSRGPVFFVQRRVGKNGREFPMYKFRTMITAAEQQKLRLANRNEVTGPMFKMSRDPRRTRLGAFLRKLSLDELPQLFNVVRGDMSLVGPRPLVMEEMKWAPKWRDLRLRVKPGITGLWQVNGRGDTGFEGWIEYDVAYVRDQSLLLDLRILCKTIPVMISRTGAV